MLKDRVVMMAGAGAGVGRAIALLAADAGADLALIARTPTTLEETAQLVRGKGRRALCLPGDVSDPRAVARIVSSAIDHYGRLDILVHSILPPHLLKTVLELEDSELDAWKDSVSASVFGALLMSRAVGKQMAAAGNGSIVFITATSALQGYPTVSAHAAGKAGIHSLAQCLASEFGVHGIRVNCVAPGVILGATVAAHISDPNERERFIAQQAALNALKRMPTDQDVAEAALYLASDASRGITGQILAVDGGRFFH